MSDPISRQTAIDEWRNDFKGYVNALDIPRDDYNGIMEYIDELPSTQPEPQWTPCKKKLPDEDGHYLVTDDSGGLAETHESYFVMCDDGSASWAYANVVAWMKMPDPYGGEQHERSDKP